MSDLRERVAKAMRDVYLARQPKYSGAEGYPLEEFFPEAAAAIAIVLEEAARTAERMHRKGQIGPDIAAAIRAMIPHD